MPSERDKASENPDEPPNTVFATRCLIAINLLAAGGFVVLGLLVVAIHESHNYSTYREFIGLSVVDEQQLETILTPDIPQGSYNVLLRMRQIGNVEAWINRMSWLAALACVLNAAAIYFMHRKRGGTPKRWRPRSSV